MLPQRTDPKGKKVSLFATCLVDSLFPGIGIGTIKLLRSLGVEIDFPEKQTCCGQPAYNSGYQKEAAEVAVHFLNTFKESEVIVVPSGSCTTMIRHEYPRLFKNDSEMLKLAMDISAKTWELSEFIRDGLGIKSIPGKLSQPTTVAFHDSCHGLRMLGLSTQARDLVGSIENVRIDELKDSDVCCGFGGLFSIKMSDVSGAMLQKKIESISSCPADLILLGDSSCMMHIQGGLDKQKIPGKIKHFVELLAEAIS